MSNILFYGDNLDVLRKQVKDESVDLIYLDPPFNSKRDYNVIFKEADGNAPAAQIRAFGDTWQYTQETARTKEELNEVAPAYGCPKLPLMIDGFVDVLGHNDVTAYLIMMAIRLLELKRALKPTGSIYFHCDPTMEHYIKVMLDILLACPPPPNGWRMPQSRANQWLAEGRIEIPPKGKIPAYKRYLDEMEGPVAANVWDDIPPINSQAKEALGYPTQKPEALLKRIVKASSNEGDEAVLVRSSAIYCALRGEGLSGHRRTCRRCQRR